MCCYEINYNKNNYETNYCKKKEEEEEGLANQLAVAVEVKI